MNYWQHLKIVALKIGLGNGLILVEMIDTILMCNKYKTGAKFQVD